MPAPRQLIRRFKVPEAERFTNAFCTQCGGRLPRLVPELGVIVLPAGSLDNDPGLKVRARIYWDSRAQWSCEAGGLPVFAETEPMSEWQKPAAEATDAATASVRNGCVSDQGAPSPVGDYTVVGELVEKKQRYTGTARVSGASNPYQIAYAIDGYGDFSGTGILCGDVLSMMTHPLCGAATHILSAFRRTQAGWSGLWWDDENHLNVESWTRK